MLLYDPVCGCDGITYSNPCHAQQQGGNTAWSDGPCQDTDEDDTPDVLDCAMFDPYVYPGASCDDNDENTINDKYNDCCICEGAPLNEPNECTSDLNNDGFANAADLLLFLAGFGAVCE